MVTSTWISHKKGIYIDGHECSDVVQYRKLPKRIEILESTHLPPPPCASGLTAFDVGNLEASKKPCFNLP